MSMTNEPIAPKVYKEGEETIRVHLWVYADDVRWIDSLYSDSIKRSKFIRQAIRRVRRAIEGQAAKQAVPMHEGDLGQNT